MIKLLKYFKFNKAIVTSLVIFILLKTIGILFVPTLTASIVNNGVVKGDMNYVLETGGVMIGVAMLTGILAILSTYLSANLSATLSRDIRKKIFLHSQKLSIEDYRKFSTSSLITRCTSDANQIGNTLIMILEMVIPVPFITLIGIVLAFFKDKYMALIILITGVTLLIFMLLISRKVIGLSIGMQEELDRINSRVRQFISGIRIIRAFNRDRYEKNLMDNTFKSYADINIKMNKIFAIGIPLILFILNLCAIAILWFGAVRINDGKMLVGDIMAVIQYSIIILMYLVMTVMVIVNLPRASACSKRILEVLTYTPEIIEEKINEKILGDKKILEFRNVTFAYKDAKGPVLKNINFTCESSKTTAIIGSTGSGKSTIGKLIARLHDVKDGEILINDINIKKFSQKDLRDMISFSPQKAFLFSGTIASNIRHGKKDATSEEIRNAGRTAQADNFIMELKSDYDSIVSQGGSNFSGGQKQRICIARALIKKSDIYVFDDSFSALDYSTDARLREEIKEKLKDSIVITIAQRISTIKDADQIIVLDKGKIEGIGTHKQLMKNCPIYIEIAESQLSKEELANE